MQDEGLVLIHRVYGGGGLGDVWASVSYLGRIHQPKCISTIARDKSTRARPLSQVISLLGAGKITTTDRPGRATLDRAIWTVPYLNAVKRWAPQQTKKICYQLDGISNANMKQPPNKDLKRLMTFLPDYKFIRIGKPRSLLESVDVMLGCDLFFGICSGFSHVAHSIGIPTFLVQYKMPITPWHGHKQYTLCVGTDDLIRRVNDFLGA